MLAASGEQGWSFSRVPVAISIARALAQDPEALSALSMDRTTASYKMKFGLTQTFRNRTVEILKKKNPSHST